ncbi:MAG TPA: alpha-L-arabinofuranosidase C-terminal domain-containing protein [Tepidisphaeraceae bacterium]|nr:alpha-L-arabinofuranosidase C-terminal domain-containing protein [Tepidisphaeraceae bacterium]
MSASTITICLNEPTGIIRPELHGQFAEHLGACIDGGLWVGEESRIPNLGGLRTDVLEALRKLRPPVLRWPGGCFADDYHWEDGIGPRRERPRRVNLWWGQGIEDNHFGTHEFIHLCRYLGAKPYLAGNVGSGTVREMRDWMEYCNYAGDSTLARRRGLNGSPLPFGVSYWGVGNENWGCGGNFCPEDYAAEYKRHATYLRDLSGANLFLIACGPDGNNADWTRRFFSKLGGFPRIYGYAAHYYCGTAGPSAIQFDTNQWYELLEKAGRMEQLLIEQRALLDTFDPQRKIGLIVDEWGVWHFPTPGRNAAHLWQQNALRDALVAAITLDAFNRHADKIVMANIAQIANVLQAMVLTEGDRMILTPTYHVFDMYQPHREGRGVRAEFTVPAIAFAVGEEKRQIAGLCGSASIKGKALTLTVVNPHATLPMDANVELRDGARVMELSGSLLTHDDLAAHNTFDAPDAISVQHLVLEPTLPWRHTFPPASITALRARLT